MAIWTDQGIEASSIQDAIDALPSTGGKINIGPGTYEVKDQIKVPSNVTIQGSGWSTILKRPDDTMYDTTLVSGVTTRDAIIVDANGNDAKDSNVIIKDFMIDGNISNNAYDSVYQKQNIMFGYGDNILVENVYSLNVPLFGIKIGYNGTYGCQRAVVNKCWVNNNAGTNISYGIRLINVTYGTVSNCICWDSGIGILDQSEFSQIVGNVCYDNYQYGIQKKSGKYCSITANSSYDNGDSAIYIQHQDTNAETSRVVVSNNVCSTSKNGIEAEGISGATFTQQAIIIDSNITDANDDVGIYVNAYTQDISVTNNLCKNEQIGIYSRGNRTLISNNKVYATEDSYGIWTRSSSHCNIVGNNVVNGAAGTYGIYLQNTDYSVVSGNNCSDDQTVPTQDYGIFLDNDSTNNLINGNLCNGNQTANITLGSGTGNVAYGNIPTDVSSGTLQVQKLVVDQNSDDYAIQIDSEATTKSAILSDVEVGNGVNVIDIRKGNGTVFAPVINTSVTNGEVHRYGDYYLWSDATGDLRIKATNPTSDTDGTIVGTQS